MRKPQFNLVACLLVTGSALVSQPARAEHKENSAHQFTASEIIGMKVRNAQNEDLGKVQELIIDLNSGRMPYVVIAHGGALGAGRTKTAVPLDALQCAPDGKALLLPATKQQLEASSKTATGRWAAVQNAAWAKSVDGFYEGPAHTERYRLQDSTETKLHVRDPLPKGAELLMQPADRALCEKVCEAIDNVQVETANGMVKLYGQVESETARQNIESRVRAVPGVQKVESHLKVKNQ